MTIRKHSDSITKIKRLLLFGNTISVYFDNRKNAKLSVWFVEFRANCTCNSVYSVFWLFYTFVTKAKCCCPVQCAGWHSPWETNTNLRVLIFVAACKEDMARPQTYGAADSWAPIKMEFCNAMGPILIWLRKVRIVCCCLLVGCNRTAFVFGCRSDFHK